MLSPYIITILISWIGAHVIKYIIVCVKDKSLKASIGIFDSGGMPSAHTAVITSVSMMIGLIDGFNSGLFALALVMSIIIMHDAVRVRRSNGEQGLVINQIINEQKYDIKTLRISRGHRPLEVFAGLFLGIIISAIVFLATK